MRFSSYLRQPTALGGTMTDAKKPTRCPRCGYMPTQSRLIRTHCATCGKPLKTRWPLFPDVSVRARPPVFAPPVFP